MKRRHIGALTWALIALVSLGLATGSSAFPPAPHLTPVFKHVCGSLLSRGTCGAIVVADSNGTPLAGSSPAASALGPAQFHSAYNLPTTAPGSETIAIVDAYNDPNIEADLGTFDSHYGLPACTVANGCLRIVNQTGGTALPATNANWSLEIALDVETAHGICQNCKILLVEANSNQNTDLDTAENEAASLGANAISNSWSSSEFSSETSIESAFFNHPGVAITAATGDNGYGVGFPAASRYVTAVGGTTLRLSSTGSYSSESAWSDGGSGCSSYIAKPTWQTDTGCSTRTEADVSADADPATGAAIYDSVPYSGQSGWFQVGGTSLSTPLIAAVYALAGNTNGASTIYAHSGSLHDVTSGSNGYCFTFYLCTAGPGYDGPTGLGTPNGLGAFGGSGGSGPPTPDFSLGASPGTQTVTAGSSTTFSVTLTPSGGFSSSVGLSVSGLPTGANGSFNPTSVSSTTPGSTLTITTASTVTPGTYPLTITGTGGGLTRTTGVSLTVNSAPVSDFSILVAMGTQTVTQGGTAGYSVSLTRTGGFSGTVSFTTSGLPSGATPSFTPSSLASGGGSSTSLSVSTTSTLTPGTYPFTITATSGSVVHSAGATLVVQSSGPQAGDFAIRLSPSSVSLARTGSATVTVTISPLNGSAGSVSLSASGLPLGVSAAFSPNPTTSSATLTLTANGAQPTLGRSITITGRSGGYTHSVGLTIHVS